MNFSRPFLALLAGLGSMVWISAAPLGAALPTPPAAPPLSTPISTTASTVYVPDLTHANEPLSSQVMAWNATSLAVDVAADQPKADFLFTFTNVSDKPFALTVVKPSCGCTTAHIPPVPWMIPAGSSGQIPLSVNIGGRTGMLFKTVNIVTERGHLQLLLRVNVLPPVVRTLSDAERAQGMQLAKIDRQAVFKGDCASCHAKDVQYKYGKELYDSVCGICHEAVHRASMVPNLHELKVPTNNDFWVTWIRFGKPGSFMPAFAANQGGPLNDMQIGNLASYLNAVLPSRVPPPPH